MEGIFIQAGAIALLFAGFLFGTCVGIPKTLKAFQELKISMHEKHFGHFVNDFVFALFFLSAPCIVLIRKLYAVFAE